jgi:hypothetical protein
MLAALVALAVATQGFVLFTTAIMGLGWGGPTYVAALVQAGAAFAVISWLVTRSRAAVVLVPVASAAITVGLAFAGQAHGRATACSDQMRAAAQRLAPPPGTSVEFEGVYTEGCVARSRVRLSNQAIVEHYQAEFTRLGWQETPRGLETTIGTAAVKDGIHMAVDVEDPAGQQTLEVVVGAPTAATPCLINTVRVRGYPTLTREPTPEIEPGQWMLLADAEDLPASVVIRDSSGLVLFEQQAHSRPDDADDLLQLETPTLKLDVGDYAVECRARGAATRVPLRIAWAAPVPVEQEKAVVLRVFETPEDWK